MAKQFRFPKPKILTGEEMISEADRMARAEVEAKRGIFRDEKGGILRTKEWRENRIKELEEKLKMVDERIRREIRPEKQKILNGRVEEIQNQIINLKSLI